MSFFEKLFGNKKKKECADLEVKEDFEFSIGDNIEEKYFYRELGKNTFRVCDKKDERPIYVLKTSCIDDEKYIFDNDEKKYIKVAEYDENKIVSVDGKVYRGFVIEFAEDIRDYFETFENDDVLDWGYNHNNKRNEFFNILNFNKHELSKEFERRKIEYENECRRHFLYDCDGIKKDFFCAEVKIDRTKFLFSIKLESLNRYRDCDIETYTYLYDFRNGMYKNKEIHYFDIPKSIMSVIKDEFLKLRDLWAGRKLSFYNKNIEFDFFRSCVAYPYEPNLFEVMDNSDVKNSLVKVDRKNSECFNEFCEKCGIKPYRTLRKLFITRPLVLIFYKTLLTCGFTDINIINTILSGNGYEILDSIESADFIFFVKMVLEKKSELSAWNLLNKKSNVYLGDCLNMYHIYHHKIADEFEKNIMTDGFTLYNHNILSKIAFDCEKEDIAFDYGNFAKSLADNVGGYKFKLPKSSSVLNEISFKLNNCVSSYKHKVFNGQCTIVYMTKKNEICGCIEVCGNVVNQARGDHNCSLKKEIKTAFDIWCKKHNLIFAGNNW